MDQLGGVRQPARSLPQNDSVPGSSYPPIQVPMAIPRANFRALSWAAQFLAYRRPSWKCASCRNARPAAIVQPRRFATAASPPESKKPYYVTTPIFYVNAGGCTSFSASGTVWIVSGANVYRSTSSPYWPFIHHGRRRCLEEMAGTSWGKGGSIVDRNRRAWNEGMKFHWIAAI